MGSSARQTRGSQLRRDGVRVSAGPWTIYAEKVHRQPGLLIVALGRVAGSAVTRSRVRRIAREVFEHIRIEQAAPLDVLLLTRGDVSCRPRRQLRADLAGLVTRAFGSAASRERKPRTND